MQNAPLLVGPVALTVVTTTNLLNPAGAPAPGVGYTPTPSVIYLTHVRWINTTNADIKVAHWLGATGANLAGTEILAGGVATAGALNAGTGLTIPANDSLDWNGRIPIKSTQFLTGGASAPGVTFQAEGEIGVVGPVN